MLTPGEAKAGIIPNNISIPGDIGIVSRSGTLTYEVLYALKMQGLGASTCVGIGGDPVNGTNFIDVLELFEADPHTDRVVLIGEIGGTDEEKAADFIATSDDQTGSLLYRRSDGPAWKTDGPRRRDY